MNIQTINVDQSTASAAIRHYHQSVKKRHDAEDAAILKGYREIIKGNELLNIHDVFENMPLDDKGRPKLAICHAAQKHVYCELTYFRNKCTFFWQPDLRSWSPQPTNANRRIVMPLPGNTRIQQETVKGVVPIIPPQFRPARITKHHYILWEVEDWQRVPGDPYLLKHLGGAMFAVLAAWDLTPVEQAVLAETRKL